MSTPLWYCIWHCGKFGSGISLFFKSIWSYCVTFLLYKKKSRVLFLPRASAEGVNYVWWFFVLYCSFHWISRWLKTNHQTPNFNHIFLFFSQFWKIKVSSCLLSFWTATITKHFGWTLVFSIWFLVIGYFNEKSNTYGIFTFR